MSGPAGPIAHWREQGGQKSLGVDRLAEVAGEAGFEPVPALFGPGARGLPTGLEETYHLLLGLGPSHRRP